MRATLGVLIPNSCELRLSEANGKLDQSRPEAAMNIRDFVVYQLADQDFGAGANGLRCLKDDPAFRMSPPTTSNWRACDRLREARDWPTRRQEHDSVPLHKSDCFFRTHFSCWLRLLSLVLHTNYALIMRDGTSASMDICPAAQSELSFCGKLPV